MGQEAIRVEDRIQEDLMNYKMGDRVICEMKSRGYGKVGGWVTKEVPGAVVRVGKKKVFVVLDRVFYHWTHWLPFNRVRPEPKP